MHMGSSPIVRTNKKEGTQSGAFFFVATAAVRPRTPTATIAFKLMQNCGAVEKNAAFACKMLLSKQQGILQASAAEPQKAGQVPSSAPTKNAPLSTDKGAFFVVLP